MWSSPSLNSWLVSECSSWCLWKGAQQGSTNRARQPQRSNWTWSGLPRPSRLTTQGFSNSSRSTNGSPNLSWGEHRERQLGTPKPGNAQCNEPRPTQNGGAGSGESPHCHAAALCGCPWLHRRHRTEFLHVQEMPGGALAWHPGGRGAPLGSQASPCNLANCRQRVARSSPPHLG